MILVITTQEVASTVWRLLQDQHPQREVRPQHLHHLHPANPDQADTPGLQSPPEFLSVPSPVATKLTPNSTTSNHTNGLAILLFRNLAPFCVSSLGVPRLFRSARVWLCISGRRTRSTSSSHSSVLNRDVTSRIHSCITCGHMRRRYICWIFPGRGSGTLCLILRILVAVAREEEE